MIIAENIDIERYENDEFKSLKDPTVHEICLTLNIKDIARKEMYCSPCELKELVWGHLYSQGYITDIREVISAAIDEDAAAAAVEIRRSDSPLPSFEPSPSPEEADCFFNIKMIRVNQKRFYDESTLQKATAGVHRCALCDNSGTLFACVDVSRHNAFDKVVGKALLSGVSLRNKYIITSGRVPYDMIKKAATVHIPMIVSRSATTIAAIEAAKNANMTLLGFSRDDRFNIYCGKKRLV